MAELQEESLDVYQKLWEGGTLWRTDKEWGGIPSDQVIEQLLTRALKTRGRLTRGRGFTEVQQTVWLLSRSICAEVTNAVHEELLQLTSGTSEQHMKLGNTSQMRNATENLNTLEYMRSRNLFDLGNTNQNLEKFVTGREASSSVIIFNV